MVGTGNMQIINQLVPTIIFALPTFRKLSTELELFYF